MSYCKVKNCRYPDTHVTIGHMCGKCQNFGHGQVECGKQVLIDDLYNNYSERLPDNMQCKVEGCNSPNLHTTNTHSCKYCQCFGNRHLKRCPTTGISVVDSPTSGPFDPRKITDKQLQLTNGLYMEFDAGMGCSWFARNNNNTIEFFFMHSDMWGQYGRECTDLPRLIAFREGYSKVDFDSSVKYENIY